MSPVSINDPLDIVMKAKFSMKNESTETLVLTAGFPVSNSRYSAFELRRFNVKSNGLLRSVFNRVTGYQWHLKHIYISGPDPQGHLNLPDYYDTNMPIAKSSFEKKKARNLFGKQLIGKETYQNLMVWKEVLEAGQMSTIDVEYTIAVPTQENRIKTKKVKGNYKNIWPQEANNLPKGFLYSLPEGDAFYFFDYYLTSGASWKGTIDKQVITLRLDSSWNGHTPYRYFGRNVIEHKKQEEGKTYVFALRDAEPTANLLFALKRP